jgi:hypothetical protein
MNIVWIIFSVAIAAVMVKWTASAVEHHTQSHLGFVSLRWLAEHRLSEMSHPQG